MNAELLKQHCAGLEDLMRARRDFLNRHLVAVEPQRAVGAFPLTPAHSLRERENRSPVGRQTGAFQHLPVHFGELPTHSPDYSFELPETGGKPTDVQNTRARALLFPLPEGEGQGEGKALAPFKSVPA
jgi:hypothetical protein